MEDRQASLLVDQAARQAVIGNVERAIDLLRRALTLDSEHAHAHALLAVCLVARKRVHAADHEAGLALATDPDLPFAHYAAARVRIAQRRLDDAQTHADVYLAAEPAGATGHRLQGLIHNLRGRVAEARAAYEKALVVAPEDMDALTDLGDLELDNGRLEDAERIAKVALEVDPESIDAHVLMGRVALRRGRLDEAREHVIFALHTNAVDEGALNLLASLKARESLLLGVWWRFSTFVGELGDARSIAVLLGMYVVYRIADIAADEADMPVLATAASCAWLAFCAYTWVGPALFRRAVLKELAAVRLDPRF